MIRGPSPAVRVAVNRRSWCGLDPRWCQDAVEPDAVPKLDSAAPHRLLDEASADATATQVLGKHGHVQVPSHKLVDHPQRGTATADTDSIRFYQRVGFRMRRVESDAFTWLAEQLSINPCAARRTGHHPQTQSHCAHRHQRCPLTLAPI